MFGSVLERLPQIWPWYLITRLGRGRERPWCPTSSRTYPGVAGFEVSVLLKPFHQCVTPTKGLRLSIWHWVMLRLRANIKAWCALPSGEAHMIRRSYCWGSHAVNQRKKCELCSLLHCLLSIDMLNDHQQKIHPLQKSLAGCQGTIKEKSELFFWCLHQGLTFLGTWALVPATEPSMPHHSHDPPWRCTPGWRNMTASRSWAVIDHLWLLSRLIFPRSTSLVCMPEDMKDLNTLRRQHVTWGLEISLKLLTNLRARFLGGGRGSIQKLSFPLPKAIKGCKGRTATGFVKAEDFYGLGVGRN